MCKLRSCCSQTRAPVPKSEMNRAQPCNDHSHNHNTLHIAPEQWKIHNGGLSSADRSEGYTGEEPPLQRSKNIVQQTTNGKIIKILNEIYFMNTKYKHYLEKCRSRMSVRLFVCVFVLLNFKIDVKDGMHNFIEKNSSYISENAHPPF